MKTGMNVPIAAPPLRPRRWGLLLDATYEIEMDESRIAAGVTFTPYLASPDTTGIQRLDGEFCDDTPAESDASGGEHPEFQAWTLRATESCSALDVDEVWLDDRISDRWAAFVSAEIAAELAVGGHTTSDSPTLASSAVQYPYGAADFESVTSILDYLLASTLHGAEGMIHTDPSTFNFLVENAELVDGLWRTPTGHVIVSDAGYFGMVPEGESFDGRPWIFTSGPVGVKMRKRTRYNETAVEILDRSRNIVHGRQLADVVFAFDPNTVTALQLNTIGS